MSNSLDPDQARRFVGPDLGPNCLPRLSADVTGKQRVNLSSFHPLYLKTLASLCSSTAWFGCDLVRNKRFSQAEAQMFATPVQFC